ncbi:MAG: DUF2510 domain-containing protein [Actinobacteria bacterium]|nr:DUF2510 domain-containing protein [Actinomycetota bacterium]
MNELGEPYGPISSRYPAPEDPDRLRWWDGAAWTFDSQPKPPHVSTVSTPGPSPALRRA